MATAFQYKRLNVLRRLFWFSVLTAASFTTVAPVAASAQASLAGAMARFSLSAPASLNVSAGAPSVSCTVGVGAFAGFKGSVSLAVTGLPTGVTATFNLDVVNAGGSATLSATATQLASPGTYPLTVTGTSGVLSSSTTVDLVVSKPGFTLSASPNAVSLEDGQNGADLPVSVTVTNQSSFSSPVSVSVTGLPANVTAAFTRVNSTTQSLSFNVGAAAVPGTYTIALNGTSGDISNSTTVKLTIPAPGFTLKPSASAITLLEGGMGASSTINVIDQNGFEGAVSFSVSGVPDGVSASLDWARSAYNTTLTLSPGAVVAPGTYHVTVSGTFGQITNSTTIVLTIPAPSFTLSALPSAVTGIQGGGSVSSSINVTSPSAMSTGIVDLAVSGVPAGVMAALNWPSVSASSPVHLTVTVASNAVPGTYPLTITGTSGTTKVIATIQLTVPKPSFALSTSLAGVTIAVGGNGWNQPINIAAVNQAGLASPVALSVSGLPSTVTSAFTTVNSTTQGLTFKVGTAAVPGVYPITVTGTSGGATSKASVTLTIPAPSFSLSPSVSAVTLNAAGSTASSVITVTDQNGFTGPVWFYVSGLPAGVSASYNWASSSFESVLTISAQASAAPGTYNISVVGTSGMLISSTKIALTIPPPSFSLSLSPSALTAPVGGAGASSTISINNLVSSNARVALSITGVPAGVTTALSSSVTSTQSTVSFTAGGSAVPGIYTATLQGTSGGITKTASITLTISAPAFSISSAAGSLTLANSGTAGTTISVSGLSGSSTGVSLSTAGLPAGVTAAFGSASTSTTSSLTFSAGSAAVAGTYPISVTGTLGAASSAATIALTVKSAQSGNPTAIAITQPDLGFNVLPGSVRRIFATVTNGVTNGVNWSVSGGGTLSATTGNWVDVTAPPTGSSCYFSGTENYTVQSTKQMILTAQSQENSKMTASITINVCNPAVQVQVVPFYTTVYADQKADIQALVWGSTNRNVTWAITAQPNGGDGALMDTVNQDTAFSATVAGRYTLTATSVADHTKTNTATVYVTGHGMPYEVTTSETMPVDCTVDPSLTGTTYDVGPSQKYKMIQSVPWSALTAGSTVRIHNEDTSGANPTTYHEYFQIAIQASRTQPVRVCGVPDSRGNLPVIDASNSTGSSTVNSYSAGYAAVGIGTPGWAGVYTSTNWTGPQYMIVEGLKIQNSKMTYTYTPPGGGPATAWQQGSACIRLFRSFDTVVRGIDAYNCGNGFFSDFNDNEGFAAIGNTLYEGNHLHSNGNSGSYTEHQLYIQGWSEVVQFNVIDQYQSGAQGSNFKGRGFPEIVRYNHFGDGAARQIDMVDNQDAWVFTTFEGYLEGGTSSYHYTTPSDIYTADQLAATVEAHHADYVYGNTFVNITAGVPIHYSTDHGSLENDRIGTLWFFSNSFYEPVCNGCPNWRWYMFDTSAGGGDNSTEIEWPQIQVINNAIWLDAPTEPYFYWNNEENQFTTFGTNVINSNWGTDNMTGGDGTGWSGWASPYAFQGASNVADSSGIANLVGVPTAPFNETSFIPNPALVNAGTAMPAWAPKLPVRFQYGPAAVQTVRVQPLTAGAME